MIKAVIFDLDGTLADSIDLLWKAYDYVFSKYGHPLTREDWGQWVHKNYGPDDWILLKNLKLDPSKVRQEKNQIYDILVADEMKLKPGAEKAVKNLSADYDLAIASTSRIETVKAVVRKFDLDEHFTELLSSFENTRHKPHPDIFLRASEALGLDPEHCLVVEDSIAGYKAAKAAGMKVVICPDNFMSPSLDNFSEADFIIKSLHELNKELIGELERKRIRKS